MNNPRPFNLAIILTSLIFQIDFALAPLAQLSFSAAMAAPGSRALNPASPSAEPSLPAAGYAVRSAPAAHSLSPALSPSSSSVE
jgi:hypothetical protein